MQQIEFTVPGKPMAQPRQRHRIAGGKNGMQFVQNFTPSKSPVQTYKAAIQLAAAAVYDGPPLSNPVSLEMTFVMPRPKSKTWKTKPMPRYWHTITPDSDNLAKAVQDALNKMLWADDSQICQMVVKKVVASGDEQPRTEIYVKELSLCG